MVSHNEWYRFLSIHRPPKVNFWRPGAAHSFKAIQPGARFLFKLHRPQDYIAGGGFFLRHSVLPLMALTPMRISQEVHKPS